MESNAAPKIHALCSQKCVVVIVLLNMMFHFKVGVEMHAASFENLIIKQLKSYNDNLGRWENSINAGTFQVGGLD